jgi:hypothetical protein
MATYKVPQDVEAEDKLIGPFSFRQFVYLIIAVASGAASIFLVPAVFPLPLLAIATIPVFVLFAVIALPLRKDQPMELYVLAMVRFFLKPKRRIWSPDGTTTGVVIEAPRVVEVHLSKDLSQQEAANRLNYLADIVDTRGWAAKGVSVPQDTSVYDTVADETYGAEDMLDTNSDQARSFANLIDKQQQSSRSSLVAQMQQELTTGTVAAVPAMPLNPYEEFSQQPMIQQPQAMTAPQPVAYTPQDQPVIDMPVPDLHFNPYPQSIHQKIIDPSGQKQVAPAPVQKPEPTVTQDVSPAIINLANNNDLSIEAIAHEAQRLAAKEEGEEVVISLR